MIDENKMMTSRSHSRLCVIHLPWFRCTIPSNTSVYTDEILTLLAKVIIISVAIIIELSLSLRIWQHRKTFYQCNVFHTCTYQWRRIYLLVYFLSTLLVSCKNQQEDAV